MNKERGLSEKTEKMWDVAVIGGGPSGMMAAGRAAECGAKVILIEKNPELGRKLLITGGSRCNVTNAEDNLRVFLSKFKKNDKFLFSAFSQYGVKETLDFFHSRGMETKVENEKRVFPKSDTARSVFEVMVNYLKAGGVEIVSNCPAVKFVKENGEIKSVILKNAEGTTGHSEIRAKSFVMACGGKSRPETGSTGDGFWWLKDLGHSVTEPSSALVPIALKNTFIKSLAGLTISPVKITTLQNNVKQEVYKGKILFTHVGVSGPTVLNVSKDVGELLKYGEVQLSLDLLPTFDPGKLNAKLQEVFKEQINKKFKNSLTGLLPSALRPVIVKLSGIDPEKSCHSVTREERLHLVKLLKDFRLSVKGLLGINKAVVTSGGISLKEIDFKTMQSRLVPNLYIVGDILDIDRPSGGYSLQICWTSGYVAGTSASKTKTLSN